MAVLHVMLWAVFIRAATAAAVAAVQLYLLLHLVAGCLCHSSNHQNCIYRVCAVHVSPLRVPRHNQQQQQQSRAASLVVQAKPGDVLLVAEGISKTYDGEKQLFGE